MSNNYLINKLETRFGTSNDGEFSIKGAVQKSSLLMIIASAVGLGIYGLAFDPLVTKSMLGALGITGALGALVLSIVMCINPQLGKTVAIPFALLEGLFLGAISALYQSKYPGVPLNALLATFLTSIGVFLLYFFELVKVTERMRSIVYASLLGVCLLFFTQIIFSLFGSSIPFIFSSGPIGIAVAGLIVILSAFTLIVDLDELEVLVNQGAPKDLEWYASVSLLASIVFMYVSFLRLFGLISDD